MTPAARRARRPAPAVAALVVAVRDGDHTRPLRPEPTTPTHRTPRTTTLELYRRQLAAIQGGT